MFDLNNPPRLLQIEFGEQIEPCEGCLAKKMPARQGLLISFSGLDGAGKSTQIDRLTLYLQQSGRNPIRIWTRGGYTPLFKGLKRVARLVLRKRLPPSGQSPQRTQSFQKGWVRRGWLYLALLDLIWTYGIRVRWWQKCGHTVVCDRYLVDSLVDFRLNFPDDCVERWRLWRLLARVTPRPHLAFWVWIPVAESIRRSNFKGEPFRDSPETLARRLHEYEILAAEYTWHSLDGRLPIEDLANEVQTMVEQARGPVRQNVTR